jgi:murein DD-endopeptidase MepM/ murein hydrolase activator NlpD
MPDVLKLCKTAENVFDPRQMTAGQPYFIVRRLGQTPGVKYFILEKSIEDLVVFEFGASPRVFSAKKALEKRTRSVSCKVRSSLWNTLKENQINTDLIPKLEGLFDRRVNLSLLKPGDSLSVKYEEYYDAGHSVRVGPILAAKLTSGGTRVSAFRYSHCGTNGYFDENGNSLQTAFLPSPLTNARITSGYSARRKHPVTDRYRAHPAIDFAAPKGTPVMSVGNGTITTLDYNESSGNFIKISHSSNYTSQYLHMSGFAEGKKVGSKVIKGDVIGFVGDTGLTTGPHLDFRFTNDGKMVDYRKIDLPDGQPVNVTCIDDYKLFIQQIFIDREGIS